jgi:hypothetical protein
LLLASDVGPAPATAAAWRLTRALGQAVPPQRLAEWGGQIAPIALAVEPRIRAAALDVGGLWPTGQTPLPEVDP